MILLIKIEKLDVEIDVDSTVISCTSEKISPGRFSRISFFLLETVNFESI